MVVSNNPTIVLADNKKTKDIMKVILFQARTDSKTITTIAKEYLQARKTQEAFLFACIDSDTSLASTS